MLFSKKCLLFLGGASVITALFLISSEMTLYTLPNVWMQDYNLTAEEPPPDEDQSCHIPRIHPFDNSILPYLQETKPIHCKIRQQPLTYVNSSGFLVFNESLVNGNYPSCDYQNVERRNGDDDNVYYSERIKLPPEGALVMSDFVTVSCYNFAGIAYYTDYHAHISNKPNRDDSLKNSYSVILVGIDSLSRLAFIRQLPKTYFYLTKEMNSYSFRGMTKVGDNTYPNLVATFTGKSPFTNELPKVEGTQQTYDDWPCIWKNYSSEGYSTMYAEDRPDIALFNYLRKGFNRPPSDHYMRPFWLAVEKSRTHRLSSHLCFGSTPKHLLQLRYAEEFAKKYYGTPYFGFTFFVELSHDYVSQVTVADEDFATWLRNLHSEGYLNRTVLIFFSDHGHRFDTIRTTLVGRIEERMPFFAIYVPPSLKERNPDIEEHLKTNTGRLTSPYDIYETLLDILQHSKNNSSPLGSVNSKRAATLFGPISPKRNCAQANIPEHYCTCEVETPLSVDDEKCRHSADLVIQTINNMILEKYKNYSLCSELRLKELRRCDQSLPNRKVIYNSRVYFGSIMQDGQAKGISSKLRVIIEVEPSAALFEASLMHSQDDDTYLVTSDISRINRYGNQSSCILDAVLRKYCYCYKY